MRSTIIAPLVSGKAENFDRHTQKTPLFELFGSCKNALRMRDVGGFVVRRHREEKREKIGAERRKFGRRLVVVVASRRGGRHRLNFAGARRAKCVNLVRKRKKRCTLRLPLLLRNAQIYLRVGGRDDGDLRCLRV